MCFVNYLVHYFPQGVKGLWKVEFLCTINLSDVLRKSVLWRHRLGNYEADFLASKGVVTLEKYVVVLALASGVCLSIPCWCFVCVYFLSYSLEEISRYSILLLSL